MHDRMHNPMVEPIPTEAFILYTYIYLQYSTTMYYSPDIEYIWSWATYVYYPRWTDVVRV